MNQFTLKFIGISAMVLIAMAALSGCGILPFQQAAPTRTPILFPPTPLPTEVAPPATISPLPSPTPAPVMTNATRAATLRVTLQRLLSEHVVLLASLTASAFDGRDAEFRAANDMLDANSVEISKAIGQLYGADVEKNFLAAWRKHIGLVIDYNAAMITKDKAKQDKAVSELTDYAQGLGLLFNSANPKLARDAVADLVKMHILTIKDVIDAQAARDWPKAYSNVRKAFAHMDVIAVGLTNGIAAQFPDKFDGKADASGANLRASLTALLSEHVYLVSAATRAAFNNREAEFKAASDALDANSVDLSKAVGSVYGAEVEKNFLALWRKHIGLVVDYAQGLVKKDKSAQDKAMSDLLSYTGEFGKFLETATNKILLADAVGVLVKTHVQSLKDVIDAQFARDYPKTFSVLHAAFVHMPTIADPVSDAMVKQFADKFK